MPLLAVAGIWLVLIGVVQAFRVSGPCLTPFLLTVAGSALLGVVAYVNRDRNKERVR